MYAKPQLVFQTILQQAHFFWLENTGGGGCQEYFRSTEHPSMCLRTEILTYVIGDFIGAIRKHPEKHPLGVSDSLSPLIHSSGDEHPPCLDSFDEDVTCYCQVLPAQKKEKHSNTMRSSIILCGSWWVAVFLVFFPCMQ